MSAHLSPEEAIRFECLSLAVAHAADAHVDPVALARDFERFVTGVDSKAAEKQLAAVREIVGGAFDARR